MAVESKSETEEDKQEKGEADAEESAAKREAEEYVKEVEAKLTNKKKIRDANLNASKHWPDEMFFGDLDSSLKRNNAFVKKLKILPTDSEGRAVLLSEMGQLNLIKYIDEVATALAVDRKFKMNEIPFVIEICSAIHQRYSSFQPSFFVLIKKQFDVNKDDKSASKNVPSFSRLRIDTRYLAELTVAGILAEKDGLNLLSNFLTSILTSSNAASSTDVISFAISFVTFSGEDFAGIATKQTKRYESMDKDLKIPLCSVFTVQVHNVFYKTLNDFYSRVTKEFDTKEKAVIEIVRRNYNILTNKGELHTEKSEQYETELAVLQKLHQSMCSLADLMNVPTDLVPTITVQDIEKELEAQLEDVDGCGVVVEKFTDGSVGGTDGGAGGGGEESEFDYDRSKWPDADTRDFYEVFPDIVPMLPAALIRAESLLQNSQNDEATEEITDEPEKTEQTTSDPQVQDKEIDVEGSKQDQEPVDTEKSASTGEQAEDILSMDKEKKDKKGKAAVGTSGSASDALEDALADIGYKDLEEELAVDLGNTSLNAKDPGSASLAQIQFEKLLSRLPECVNRSHIDDVSIEFATAQGVNTQTNRMKLARTMFLVSRNRLDLLPFYSRLVATIYPCAPEVANQLCNDLYKEFRLWILKKDQIKIESKVKTVTFIGELTKFGVYKAVQTLRVLKQLLKAFVHHQVDMTCALLESAGRFMFRTRASHRLTKLLLEEMMRKRSLSNLDPRQTAMVENAFYSSNPPPLASLASAKQERLPVMFAYIQHLVTKELSKATVDKVLHQVRKLHWEDRATVDFIRQTFTAIWRVKYSNVQYVASVLAGLIKYHDHVVIQVIDNVLEDFRVGMEIQLSKFNQRRVSVIKYLGELYNYKLLDSTVVFTVLFSLITFGGVALDPPQHLFRIRLVCTLLDTCGQFFNGGTAKKKLDCFLIYFQRYLCYKREWFKAQSTENSKVDKPDAGGNDTAEESEKADKPPPTSLVDAMRSNMSSSEASLPTDVEYMISDTIEQLRPDFKQLFSLQKAQEAVDKLEKELKENYLSQLPSEMRESFENIATHQQSAQVIQRPVDNTPHDLYDINEQDEASFDSDTENDSELAPQARTVDESLSGAATGSSSATASPLMSLKSTSQQGHDVHKEEWAEESDDFIDEFEKFLSENIQQRTSESVRGMAPTDITLSLATRKKLQAASESSNTAISARDQMFPTSTGDTAGGPLGQDAEFPDPTGSPVGGGGNISIMLKKGNKVQVKDLNVPITEEMAENIKLQKMAEDDERQKLIEMTLNISKRQQEEEQQEMVSSIQRALGDNSGGAKYDKKTAVMVQGYQHTKGVPNVTHLFQK